MYSAKCNPWNNNWFDIYDYTPKKEEDNYELSEIPKDRWMKIKSILENKIA